MKSWTAFMFFLFVGWSAFAQDGDLSKEIDKNIILTNYYRYLSYEAGPIKDVFAFENSRARVDALVNFVLIVNKPTSEHHDIRLSLTSHMFYKYMSPDDKYVVITRPNDRVLELGVKDIVDGKYDSSEALSALEAYRRFLVSMEPVGGYAGTSFTCNLAWFAYALTQPQGVESRCDPIEDVNINTAIDALKPKYVADELPTSTGLILALDNLSKFMSTYRYDAPVEGRMHNDEEKQRLLYLVDSYVAQVASAIDRSGGVDGWRKVSVIDKEISKLSDAMYSQGDLNMIRQVKEKVALLCQRRKAEFPDAFANKKCI